MSCDVCVSDYCDEPWVDSETSYEPLEDSTCCYECQALILSGVKIQITTAWDESDEDGNREGDPRIYHTCVGCSQVRAAYSCGTEIYGNFWERLFDSNELTEFSMAGDCWNALGVEGKRKFQAQWQKEAGL